MSGKRVLQVASDIREHVATLLVTGRISDPRVRGVTIQEVKVSPDLSLARIYYSALGTPQEREMVSQGLRSACGFIRRSVSEALKLRVAPEIVFLFDSTTERAAQIHELLASVRSDWEGEGSHSQEPETLPESSVDKESK